MSRAVNLLNEAWKKRSAQLATRGALRIFHGPKEGAGDNALSRIAIEYFSGRANPSAGGGDGSVSSKVRETSEAYAWVFSWEQSGQFALTPFVRDEVISFLRSIGVKGAVLLDRPEKGAPEDASVLFGELPEMLDVNENGLNFRIRFLKTKHPGLFLDHAPLRDWLTGKDSGAKSLNSPVAGKTVLNTFAYTGSLSVAAAKGGAAKVTTLDLSKPTTAWGKENWELNFGVLSSSSSSSSSSSDVGIAATGVKSADGGSDVKPVGDFIFGDVFEWLPKLIKRGEKYDVVILDPPSFSRSPKKVFSTSKDLPGLHALALQLLNSKGTLITSINSAQISHAQFRSEIDLAAKEEKRKLTVIAPLAAPPESFPGADYLKGWIFRVD